MTEAEIFVIRLILLLIAIGAYMLAAYFVESNALKIILFMIPTVAFIGMVKTDKWSSNYGG